MTEREYYEELLVVVYDTFKYKIPRFVRMTWIYVPMHCISILLFNVIFSKFIHRFGGLVCIVSSIILEGVLKRGESLWNNIVILAFVVSHIYVKKLF